jgi:uncharacterized Fe-S center protein
LNLDYFIHIFNNSSSQRRLRGETVSKVYYALADAHEKKENNLLNKIERLYDRLGIGKAIRRNDLVAIKTHIGEEGSSRFLRPLYIAKLVECVKKDNGRPFITDTNTYYVDHRHNAYEHHISAQRHGFYPPTINAPFVVADGLVGADHVKIKVNGEHYKEVKIGSGIHQANSMIVTSHFKGHVVTGFGGALKNIGVGCASRDAKIGIHGAIALISIRCTGCGKCIDVCLEKAIKRENDNATPYVDTNLCKSCGACSLVCTDDAIDPDWDLGCIYTKEEVQERMVEHGVAAVKGKKDKTVYLNFLMDITPECDCEPWSDVPIVKDLGILASWDPVAVDQASVDLVNKEPGIIGTMLEVIDQGVDKFHSLNGVNWSAQLAHGEKMGLGTREYELLEV